MADANFVAFGTDWQMIFCSIWSPFVSNSATFYVLFYLGSRKHQLEIERIHSAILSGLLTAWQKRERFLLAL